MSGIDMDERRRTLSELVRVGGSRQVLGRYGNAENASGTAGATSIVVAPSPIRNQRVSTCSPYSCGTMNGIAWSRTSLTPAAERRGRAPVGVAVARAEPEPLEGVEAGR